MQSARATRSTPTVPTLRPLLRGLLLAMATGPAGVALAADLDGETAEVVAGDPVEAWRLRNDSLLTLGNGAAADTIDAQDSRVIMDGAMISRDLRGTGRQQAVDLSGNASLDARNTTFKGAIRLYDTSSVMLTGSRILITRTDSMRPTDDFSWGLVLSSSGSAGESQVRLDSTFIKVEDAPDQSNPNQHPDGVGVQMGQGTLEMVNGSRIEASKYGVVMFPVVTGQTFGLHLDNSTLSAGTGAAIWVRTRGTFDGRYDISLSNGSQIHAGDGTLLQLKGTATPVAGRAEVNLTIDDSRVAGDVLHDLTSLPNGSIDVLLRNKAQIDGRFINVASANIGSDSTWLLTGDSNVGRLALGSTGTIGLGDGTAFNTLNVDTFTGNGGTLAFNTHLGDDASATDKLVITGDANGQANVRVLNAGGTGAKTERGIELIDIAGASNAQFDLVGRAVGGQYEYFLVKDANGNWYLRSALATVPDPCVVDPTLPECKPIDPVDPVDPVDPPPPVLRPEAGAYLANQFAMDQLLRHGWRDRQGGDATAEGVRGWARVDGTQSKLSAVEDQLDLRVQRSRLQLGADVGVFDNGRGRVGAMFTAGQADAQSRSQLTGYSARGKVEGGALGVYGNWNADALYVDASVQRGQFRNRVQGEGLAAERYDSDIWQSSLEAGYRFNIGQIGSTALSLQPELQLVYTDAKTDVHTETNGTVVRAAGNSGLSGRAGLRLQGESRSAAGASVSPYLAANWYRDGAGNGIAFDDEVLKAGIPRNRYELSAGARVDFRSGFSAWGGFGVTRGDSGYREATANLSVAYKW